MKHRLVIALAIAAATLAPALQAQPALSGEKPTIKVGDTWLSARIDRLTGAKEAETRRTVTSVTADRIEGTENQGKFVLTSDYMAIETPDWVRTGTPRFVDFPLSVGKKWSFKYEQKNLGSGGGARWQYDAEVLGIEKVKVPAGEFDAFKIVYRGFYNSLGGANGSSTVTNWYAPAARATVRSEFASGRNTVATEIIEIKLQP